MPTAIQNEPGSAVLTLFNQIVDRVKNSRPVRSDKTRSLAPGYVYSQLVLGMPIAPEVYGGAWSPMGGASLQTAAQTAAAAGVPDPKFRRSMQAAFNTSQLADELIMVTKDDSYQEYPTSRKVSFAYENIINGMQ